MESTEQTRKFDVDVISEVTGNLSETARILFSARGVTNTLSSEVELAVATIEGCDFAGLMLVEDGELLTPVCTDPVVVEVDACQRQSEEGPCIDAIDHGLIFYADDLENDARWTCFSSEAIAAGIRSVLALPLVDDGQKGALNLYARYPAAFGVVDRGKAVVLASLASMALSAAQSHEYEERRTENLEAALLTRQMIGQGEGILMQRERITAAEAFDILRRASQHLNLKLREVARNVVETGEVPDTGSTSDPVRAVS
jgi:AmiR/NasT family two-component response regulator